MDLKLQKIIPQLITVLVVVLVFGFFTYNAQINMENRGIDFGYGFLSQESSFDVQFSLIEYDGSHSYFRAYLVGLLNTILVSVIGIIIATILGVIVGVARLSPNYLINQFAAFYVEFFRNIPLLLQIFFWYFAALRALPLPQDADAMLGVFFLTIKGLYVPAFVWENLNVFLYSIIAAIIAIVVIRIHARKVQETQGKQLPVFWISVGLIFILPLLSFLIGGVSLSFEIPKLKQIFYIVTLILTLIIIILLLSPDIKLALWFIFGSIFSFTYISNSLWTIVPLSAPLPHSLSTSFNVLPLYFGLVFINLVATFS